MGFMDFFRKKNSGEVAKDRLKLLLISDRANCSPEVMEAIKNDIIKIARLLILVSFLGIFFSFNSFDIMFISTVLSKSQ